MGGLSIDAEGHYGDVVNISTVMVGPRLKFRQEHFEPFVHALVGLHRLSVAGLGTDNRIGTVLGGGFDMPLTRIFGLRLIEADYVWAHHNFRPTISDTTNLTGARLRSGIVLNFGGGAAARAAGCQLLHQPDLGDGG